MNIIKKSAILLLISIAMTAYTMTPSEIFNNGKRAYNLGHWQESEEFFNSFIDTWPGHHLEQEARLLSATAKARNYEKYIQKASENFAQALTNELNKLKKQMPNRNFSELEVAIDQALSTALTWDKLKNADFEYVKQAIRRSWHPDPAQSPIETLNWLHELQDKHASISPEIESRLLLIKTKALFQLYLSPLPLRQNSNIIKMWGEWPVHNAIERSLERGFRLADASLRREFALIGLHFSYINNSLKFNKSDSQIKCRWYSYLNERGLNPQEAWWPR